MSFFALISRKLWAKHLSAGICHTCKHKPHVLLLWVYAFLCPKSENKTQKLLVEQLRISPEEHCPREEVAEKGLQPEMYELPHPEFPEKLAQSSITSFFSRVTPSEEQLTGLPWPLRLSYGASWLGCSWTAKLLQTAVLTSRGSVLANISP